MPGLVGEVGNIHRLADAFICVGSSTLAAEKYIDIIFWRIAE
jgi:hypothetical protein